MRDLRILAVHTLREHLRSQGFLLAVCFSAVLIYVSVLLGALAVDEEVRVLMDFGLTFIELMAVSLAVFGAANGILREMDTKTIYLILSRPVSRGIFLVGRYAGLLLSAGLAVAAMSAAHLSLLFAKGWIWNWAYPLALCGIMLKLAIATALATVLALMSTSVLSALTMTGIAWVLGHFLTEIQFLVGRTPHALTRVSLEAANCLLPNLQLMNFRDRPETSGSLALAAGYAVLYSGACLALSYGFFRKREF